MMFNKILLTSVAVVGLALTAVNSQFNNSKSTTDQAVKVSGSVNGQTVKTAVSSLDNIKSLETSAANQEVASNDDAQAEDTQEDTSADTSSSNDNTTAAQVTTVSAPVQTVTEATGDINWLIQRESSGNVNASNGSFYGIGQLSPSAYATYAAGQDYVGNYAVQLQAMQGYIAARYGTVANAISHFQSNGWY
ncbi:peptidoglycan-binding protein [Fructobacillus sp. M1-13]|uniref:Peptidoglycan-binding protein n=1 Tax=Fructobacillus papyriferae TaxID=2713171 RepID=A0ABS5QQE1_9LACO|nr:peptidoglycan-binding protein [Fructobacillus papyriferae]MBS9335410.1 peptidoglycan-binding protein [Fructobacillus papyriferae]MCD2158920.1 peptidoglycan-binding protein [Fructobacillus papyriferae]